MPVPAVVKATIVFEQVSRGWTESFLFQAASDDLTLQDPSVDLIAQKRAALLGKEARIKATRVSFESNQNGDPVVGDSLLKYRTYYGAIAESADDEAEAVLVTLRNATATRRKNMFLRGIWDDVNAIGGFYLPTISGWQSAFNSWAGALLARGAGWWHSNAQPKIAIIGYTVDQATGFVLVTIASAVPGFVVNKLEEARISGVNNKSPINGMQLIRWASPTTFWLERPLALIEYQFGGQLTTYQRTFEQASTIDGQKIVTRRAGSPLLESRGRRKARVRS